MTNPIPHGYPDWGRQSAASDLVVTEEANTILAAQATRGPFFVGNMSYLEIVAETGFQDIRITVQWAKDSTFATLVGTQILGVPNFGSVDQAIPVRGPYVKFIIDALAYPNTITFKIYQQQQVFAQTNAASGSNVLLEHFNVLIGAGGNIIYLPGQVRGGWAFWRADLLLATNFVVYLYTVSFAGVRTMIDYRNTTNRGSGSVLFIPPTELQMHIFNLDVAGRDFLSTLTYHPHHY